MFGGSINKTNLKNHLLPYLYHAGDNRYFASGDALVTFYTSPKLVHGTSGWEKISTNKFRSSASPTTLAIKNGELWAWGDNGYGQLGDGTSVNKTSPVRIGTESNWEEISVGGFHTLAIRGGGLYSWGNNGNGQLGLGNNTNYSSPLRIGTDGDWSAISAGHAHSLGIRNTYPSPPPKGTLWAWGYNFHGQLGIDNRTDQSSPVQVATPTGWAGAFRWKRIAAGVTHSLATGNAINNDGGNNPGNLFGWGSNSLYECGHTLGETYENWNPATITSGYWWYWWWWNQQGPPYSIYASLIPQNATGAGSGADFLEIDAGRNSSLAIKNTDDLYYFGNALNTGIATNLTFFSSGVIDMSMTANEDVGCSGVCGQGFAYIRDASDAGTAGVYTVGFNDKGQLGNGTVQSGFVSTAYNTDASSDYTDISFGQKHVFAIKNGYLYGWGSNLNNLILNDENYTSNRISLTKIERSKNKFNFINVHGRSCFGIINGELWAWGSNSLGELGDGTTIDKNEPVRIGNEVGWTMAQSNGSSTLGIKNGELYSWGHNGFSRGGRPGGDSSSPIRIGTESTWTAVGTAETFGFAIREGKLFCFGWNIYNQAGGAYPLSLQRSSPVQIGTDTNWTSISGSWLHALGIRNGQLYAWGTNNVGQLGLGNTVTRSSPVQVGTESGWTIAWAGARNSIGIRDGKLFTWGSNSKGQLGDGTTVNRSSPVQIGSATDWSWAFTCGGGNDTSDSRTCVAIRNGELYAWGQNSSPEGVNGILGDGTSTNRSSPVRIGTLSNWIMSCSTFDTTLAIR